MATAALRIYVSGRAVRGMRRSLDVCFWREHFWKPVVLWNKHGLQQQASD